MIHPVRSPLGARPRWNTRVFFMPMMCCLRLSPLDLMILSLPVAFQYPASVALFDLLPLGYLRSLGAKKNHSGSSDRISDLSAHTQSRQQCSGSRNGNHHLSRASLFYTRVNKVNHRRRQGFCSAGIAPNQIASRKRGGAGIKVKDSAEFEGIASGQQSKAPTENCASGNY